MIWIWATDQKMLKGKYNKKIIVSSIRYVKQRKYKSGTIDITFFKNRLKGKKIKINKQKTY